MSTDRQGRGSIVHPDGTSTPLTVTWLWDRSNPFDVRAGWHVDGTQRPVWWTIPRDVLLVSLTRSYAELVACDGLVEFAAMRLLDLLIIDLDNGTERTRVVTGVGPLRDLLCASYVDVPPGREPVDVDSAIAALLEGEVSS